MQILIFVLAFQTEVRVKAHGSSEKKNYKSSPENCVEEAIPCAIEVGDEVARFKQNGNSVHLSQKSFVVRESASKWTYIKGNFWVESGRVQVKTAFAELKSSAGGMWITPDLKAAKNKEEKLWVLASKSDVEVELRNHKTLTIPEGFRVWIGKSEGRESAGFGMPEPIPWEEYVLMWGPIYPGSAKEFKSELLSLRKEWEDLADRGGDLYASVVNRQIAMAKDEEEAKRKKLLAEEAQKKALREVFKKKTLDQ